jgi:hypothetical protein
MGRRGLEQEGEITWNRARESYLFEEKDEVLIYMTSGTGN